MRDIELEQIYRERFESCREGIFEDIISSVNDETHRMSPQEKGECLGEAFQICEEAYDKWQLERLTKG